MRRHAILPVVAAAAFSLAACGGGGSGATVEVEGDFGEPPTLTFPEADPPAELVVDVLSEGDGEEVSEGDFLVADYVGQVWGAEEAFDGSFARGQVAGFSLDQVVQGWQQGLPGTHVGDRVLLTIPSELGYPEGNPDAGIAAGDTIVFVVDVLASFSPDEFSAQRDATDTGELAGLPVIVTGGLGERASLEVKPDGATPTELSLTTIAEGTGETVGDSGSVVVSFAAVGWDGTDGGSTWDYGAPETIPMGSGSVFDGLSGVPVGSRVVALMPEAPNADGSATPPIAAVIDIVGYVP